MVEEIDLYLLVLERIINRLLVIHHLLLTMNLEQLIYLKVLLCLLEVLLIQVEKISFI